jgi:tetratricopeptide (TPR) repeat protein
MAEQFAFDPRYKEVSALIQHQEWDQALTLLNGLAQDYPGEKADILPLLEHVQMKRKVVAGPAVRGRSSLEISLFNRKFFNRIGAVLLLAAVMWGGWLVVDRLIVPVRAQYSQNLQVEQLLMDAKSAMSATRWSEAQRLYGQVLAQEPDLPEAVRGLTDATRQITLATAYDEALRLVEADRLADALTALVALQEQEPTYRDVTRRIDELRGRMNMTDLFAQAEAAFAQEAWDRAIPLYEEIRRSNLGYESQTVESHLRASYILLADDLSVEANLSLLDVDEIGDLYRKALALQPRDRDSRLKEQMLSQYIQAILLLDEGQNSRAVALLDEVYQNSPILLGGDVMEGLYQARLAYGQELERAGNIWPALIQYMAAADLPVQNNTRATLLARTLSLVLTPSPTPTPTETPIPTPTPTATPDPFDEIRAMLPPTPSPIEQYVGWVAFKSDRPGSGAGGLWVISPDGSQQLPVSDPNGHYEHLKNQVRWSNDNQRRLWVEDDGSGMSVAIYMWRYDLPTYWLDARVELLNNSAINYHVAYSPDNSFVVFTSQRSRASGTDQYGDEIFMFRFSDFNSHGYVTPIRLTRNDWEWDKHPTVSMDNRTIYFWSNRETGRAQIWAMNVDGSNQRNMSNNEWNDWDPVVVLPPREIPNENPDSENGPGVLFDPSKFEAGRGQ